MKLFKMLMLATFLIASPFVITACEQKSDFEKGAEDLGDSIEEGAEELSDEVDDATTH